MAYLKGEPEIILRRIYVWLYLNKEYIANILIGLLLFYRFYLLGYVSGYVFDEVYYVNVGKSLIHGGLDKNLEHPPLAKALIALSIYIFGDKPLSWRIPSFIAAVLILFIIYELMESIIEDIYYRLILIMILLLDIHYFNLMSMAILDPISLFLILSAIYLTVKDFNPVYIGVTYGLAILAKLQAIVAAPPIVLLIIYKALNKGVRVGKTLLQIIYFGISTVLTFLTLLYIYDVFYTQFHNPLQHIEYMLSYHAALTYTSESEIIPLYRWLTTACYEPIPYYILRIGKHTLVSIVGVTTPFTTAWIPILIGGLYIYLKKGVKLNIIYVTYSTIYLLFYVYLEYISHRYVYPFYIFYIYPVQLLILSSFVKLEFKYFRFIVTLLLFTQAVVFFKFLPTPIL